MKKYIIASIGTVSLAALFAFTPIASAAPSLSIQGIYPGTGIRPGQTVTFFVSSNGFFGNPTFSVSGGGTIDSSGNYSWTPAASDAGSHTVTVSATDPLSNTATASVNIFVIPGSISIQNLLPGQTAFTNEPVTFSVNAPGYTNPAFSVSDNYAGTSVVNADISTVGQFSWSPKTNEQGAHLLTVSASDAYGHQGQVLQPITVIPQQLQITDLNPGTTVPAGTPVTFTASSTGLASPITYAVTDSMGRYSSIHATTTMLANGNFSWTPIASDIGSHTLTLTATDAHGGSANASVTLAIVAGGAATSAPQPSSTAPITPTANPVPTQSGSSASLPAISASSGATATGNSFTFTRNLSLGMQGNDVTELQKYLTASGSYSGPITGYFGRLTEAGVQKFQASHGIASSGSPFTTGYGAVGPKTRAALNAGSSGSANSGATPQSLNGLSFALTSANGSVLPSGETYTLSFANGQAQAKFCNSMNGVYTVSGSELSATMASTLMYCSTPTDAMMLESAFQKMMASGATYALSGNMLVLVGASGSSMVFTKNAN